MWPGRDAIHNELPSWPLMKVWPGGQRHQVMHNDVLTRCTTVGYFGGDQALKCMGVGDSYQVRLRRCSPWGQWRHTAAVCMGWNLQLTGSGCPSVRRSTNPRYTMWASWGWRIYALAPLLTYQAFPTRGMTCVFTLATSTGGVGSGSFSNTPTLSPCASAAGSYSHWGG